ncbi:MAG: metal-sensitive transcriptional regulator [Alphaproteobacteria bacterium]|jgi:DNA-binding FrmR family transcriptional regulator|nr:metal-sensitive transcriptional regulator [Alphaproteobacteria bacterium]
MTIPSKPNHADNLPRLSRISGQIDGIKKMIEEERYCVDIVNQIKAVRSALKSVEKNILQKHIKHCVAASFKASKTEQEQKINELISLFDKSDD